MHIDDSRTARRQPRYLATLAAVACLGICNAASAAVVAWSLPITVSGDADINTLGAMVEAANLSGNASGFAATTTVNGVTFTGWLPAGAGVSTSPGGHFVFAPAPGHFLQSFDGFGSVAAPFSALSANYRTLLTGGSFSQNQVNANDFTGPMTLTLSGLSPGAPYQFQWWTDDSRPFATGPITATTGLTSVSLDPNTTDAAGGVGQFVTGTFTADAPTQVITFSTTGNGNVQNAFQLRMIPEPSTAALLAGFAALATSIRRRRRD
jgi:hypothetical protein